MEMEQLKKILQTYERGSGISVTYQEEGRNETRKFYYLGYALWPNGNGCTLNLLPTDKKEEFRIPSPAIIDIARLAIEPVE